ncbi:transcription regulator protein BACH1-like [Gadus chalcogrammus]|uniref:transcription regulator protein BACH1-like n=1 Tax=Gadus chalcogrammus TaxID=1042646 RepID=UPI0024C4C0C6|nr:transcription regulator protein BACH1-like [Gadus chalcogrammus]
MSLPAPRSTSGFTFESAVHAAHVLRRLDEQRRRDALCDVTVATGDQHFRAHAAVLASCSDFFHGRVSGLTGSHAVITLPEQVTAEGFEPLLQFAYTSKLLFTKDNIHAIHQSAEALGFHNMESACFNFLLPKFSSSQTPVKETDRRRCCQTRPPALKRGMKTGQADRGKTVPSEDPRIVFPSQCPLNPQPSMSGEEEEEEEEEDGFCLETYASRMPGITGEGVCPILSLPCPEATANTTATTTTTTTTTSTEPDLPSSFCQRDLLDLGGESDEHTLDLPLCSLRCPMSTSSSPALLSVTPADLLDPAGGPTGPNNPNQPVETMGAEIECSPASCCLVTAETHRVPPMAGLPERGVAAGAGAGAEDRSGLDDVGLPEPAAGLPPGLDLTQEDVVACGQRSSVEREVAEHLATGFWPHLDPADPGDQGTMAKAADFHWLKQLDLSSSTGDCPFLRDLGGVGDVPGDVPEAAAGVDSLSLSERSPYMSSSLNSADDSDVDTEEDDKGGEVVAEVQLPFPVDLISRLSRSAFQQLLRQHKLSAGQLEYVHDVRRRSKNRAAAQRCRKRKLDSIQTLEVEINTLQEKKRRMMEEHVQLEQDLGTARRNLSKFSKTVGEQSDPQQDHLQLLAKVSAADCPASSLLVKPGQEEPFPDPDPQALLGIPGGPPPPSTWSPGSGSLPAQDPQAFSWGTESEEAAGSSEA